MNTLHLCAHVRMRLWCRANYTFCGYRARHHHHITRATRQPNTPTLAAGKDMFCFQCEQTEGGKGCTVVGVCGKTPQVAHLQDGLVHALKGLAAVAVEARTLGVKDPEADHHFLAATFATLTNVNFDPDYFVAAIPKTIALRDGLRAKYEAAAKAAGKKVATFAEAPAVAWKPAGTGAAALEEASLAVGVLERRESVGVEAACLQELIMYGVKGSAAYAEHAHQAGVESEDVYAGLYHAMAVLARNEADIGKLVAEAMAVGTTNVATLKALDDAHTKRFGAPVPTPVNHAPTAGKAILISGHDLVDLQALLEQTEGTGINVYTHGEMLPAHGYPGLSKYKHLAGHYGNAWQLQRMEYGAFPGPIIQSTNCIMEPRASYKGRLFTTNSTGWPGVTHIPGRDFAPVIAAAKEAAGFRETKPAKHILTGFGHGAVMGVAPAVIDAVKAGKLTKFVLIGGCDGSESERSYYTKVATGLPDSSVILTLGCGKFRVLGKKDYGVVPGTGIPRVLDMGQCNDSYSAVVVATELAKAFNTDINSLPLSIVLSWFEQKAVAVLLTLLSLGVKNIRIGPALPAFVTPATLDFLVKTFNLMPINAEHPEDDLKAMVGK